jgi:hypothetical protein
MDARWFAAGCLAACLLRGPSPSFAQSETSTLTEDFLTEDAGDASLVSFLQPRLQTGAMPAEGRQRSARSSQRSSYVQLARAPNMFGDSMSIGQLIAVQRNGGTTSSDLPMAGGRLFKVSENNSPIPRDRVYFVYNGFQNAVTTTRTVGGVPVANDTNLNRYTFAFEKTFFDGWWSLDVRMPFSDDYEVDTLAYSVDSGHVGNLSMFLKHLVYEDETLAAAIGVGVGLPTGSNINANFDGTPLVVQNEATHLLPYFGFLATPWQNWFFQGFFELDFAANGNDVVVGGINNGPYTEQNQLHADLSAGRWLYRNEYARYGTGVAALVELHYTTTIQDTDTVPFLTGGSFNSGGTITNTINRFDVLNLTAGLHFQLTDFSNLRVAAVAPLRTDPDRQFDSEIQVSFNRYF